MRDVRSNPYAAANAMDIEIVSSADLPWEVASDGDTVLCAAHEDPVVMEARAWEGIAQCVLTRLGMRWTANQAVCLGALLRSGAPVVH